MGNTLSNMGFIISLLLGIVAIIAPSRTEALLSIKGIGKEGVSEIRATYGGFFVGMSCYALLVQSSTAFLTLGMGWITAAIVRLATLFMASFPPPPLPI